MRGTLRPKNAWIKVIFAYLRVHARRCEFASRAPRAYNILHRKELMDMGPLSRSLRFGLGASFGVSWGRRHDPCKQFDGS